MNTIKYNLQDFDFEKLARTEPNPKARIRLLILAHLKEGKTQVQAANALKVSPASVKRTYKRFKDSGVDDLKDKPKSGAGYKLPKNQHQNFKDYILEQQKSRKGGRLTGYDIKDILKEKYNANYGLSGVYRLLHHLKLSYISSRSQHPKHNEQVQDTYKKTSKTWQIIFYLLPLI